MGRRRRALVPLLAGALVLGGAACSDQTDEVEDVSPGVSDADAEDGPAEPGFGDSVDDAGRTEGGLDPDDVAP